MKRRVEDEGKRQGAEQQGLTTEWYQIEAERQQLAAVQIIWLRDPEQESLRRAFSMWLQRVLLPARLPAVPIPEMQE